MGPLPVLDPMLATAGSLPLPSGDDQWAVEIKQDGQRALIYLPGDGTVTIRSRGGHAVTAAYPELHGLPAALGTGNAVLDGEIIAPDADGRPDFERLQARMGLTRSPVRAARLAARVPVHLALFDVLILDGRDLTSRPWTERRQALTGLGLNGPAWSVPTAAVGHAASALEATRTAGWEGIVAKRLTSRYRPGVRSTDWLKIKNVRTTDAIVGGWVPGTGRLTGLPGAVLLGELCNGLLRYTGSVGTGWNDRERRQLADLLAVAAWPACPFTPTPKVPAARWVLPRLVAEITYTTRTRAGYLRHPSWHRLRPDLAPDDLT
ncbi:ATP-dependent DNA ligase [Streptomyces sp. 8L]|uniref:ATP-dependent DNA ligase n=1 Tax=Streptomyces sp. 8L TaxID=2877242 RepID=UPI001CD1F426|nr:RNA ligase family protein [Streptomyces sp. 8L]MCA1217380.1 ATP-dependent DNA ligase [Streptomyces sp. 8L]